MSFNRVIITYSEDTTKLGKELLKTFPERVTVDEEGSISFDMIKTKTVRNNKLTLSALLVKTPSDYELLKSLKNLKVLGSFETIFSTPSLDEIYRKVYDYTKPIVFKDSDGRKVSFEQPKKFCDFS